MAGEIVLAIETSQRAGSVAVSDGQGAVCREAVAAPSRQDDDVLPAIDRLLRRTHLEPAALDAVAVSVGPGGFTGLRIAVATAKMFAEALGARVLAVPSALVAGESCDRQGPILVALASKPDRFWATRLARTAEGSFSIAGDPALVAEADLDVPGVQAVLADEYLPAWARARCQSSSVDVIEPVFDAMACLSVAQRMLNAGQVCDPLTLRPIYPGPPEAVRIWRQRRARG